MLLRIRFQPNVDCLCMYSIILLILLVAVKMIEFPFFSDNVFPAIHITRLTSNVSLLILALFVKNVALFDHNVNKNNNKPDST